MSEIESSGELAGAPVADAGLALWPAATLQAGSAWRAKGDIDVVKMLCKKSSLK